MLELSRLFVTLCAQAKLFINPISGQYRSTELQQISESFVFSRSFRLPNFPKRAATVDRNLRHAPKERVTKPTAAVRSRVFGSKCPHSPKPRQPDRWR